MAEGRGAGDKGQGQVAFPMPHAPCPTPPRLVKRILIIGPSNIGDAILAGDVVSLVAEQYPGGHLTLVVGSRATALFADDPRVHTLVDAGRYDSAAGRLRLAAALWRFQPHVVVDLRHTLYPLLLKPLSAWRYLLPPPRTLTHMRDRHLWKLAVQAPAAVRGTAPGARRQPLWLSARDTAHAEALLARWQLGAGQPLVVMCPGARSHIKRWTAEGFAHVADRLIRERRADVVFSGEPEEETIIDEITGLMQEKPRSVVGRMTIRQLGALMRRAALVITNDSASLHAASAAGTPTVAVFGPTDARKYGPTAPRARTVARRLSCAPCERPECRFHHECMRFVSAEEVYGAACELLGGHG